MKNIRTSSVLQHAVIYFRVSHEDQDDMSQRRELHDYAKRNGFQIVREYSEGEAWTGSDSERPQWLKLLADAESISRDFQFLLSCELDRLGRTRHTREDLADLVDAGVHVICTRDGTDTRDENSDLILDIKANQAGGYSKSVARHTRAKMIDRAKQKQATGKPPFGYRIFVEGGAMQTVHGADRLMGARRTYAIDDEAANWVRRMFEWFVEGNSSIAIAAKLNGAGAPSPRGRGWIGSSVSAVIDNSMYLGQIIYNKSKWVARSRKQRRAAGLGRRKRTENPPDQWIRQDAPELKIITDQMWQAAQSRRAATNHRWHGALKSPRKDGRGLANKNLFTLRCGICGGTVTRANGHKLGCSKRLNSGGTGCTMNALASLPETNAALISLVKEAVLAPDMLALFVAEVQAETARSEISIDAAHEKRNLEKAEKEISNLIEAIAVYGMRDNLDVQKRLKAATDRRDSAKERLAANVDKREPKHALTATADDLRAILDAMVGGEIDDPATLYRARALLGELVEPFDAYPHADGMEFRAKLKRPGVRNALTPTDFVIPRGSSKFVGKMVAGARFASFRHVIPLR